MPSIPLTLPQGSAPEEPSGLRASIVAGLDRASAIEQWALVEPHAFVLAGLVAEHVRHWSSRGRLVSLGTDGSKEFLLSRRFPDVHIEAVDIDAGFIDGLRRTFRR